MGGQENGADLYEPISWQCSYCYCYFPMEMKQTRRICPRGIAQIVLCMGALSSGHGFCPLCAVPSDVSLLHLNTYALSPGGHVHSVS